MTEPETEPKPRFLSTAVTERSNKQRWISYALILAVPLLVAWLVSTFLIGNYNIPSASMQNTLMIGDRIFTVKPGAEQAKQGDIIVFSDDQGWLNGKTTEGNYLIKRIAATEGQTIACCDAQGRITVDGIPYDEPWQLGNNISFPTQTVPPGSVFVLGDNREDSADSRYHIATNTQFISRDSIKGVAVMKYWPSITWLNQ